MYKKIIFILLSSVLLLPEYLEAQRNRRGNAQMNRSYQMHRNYRGGGRHYRSHRKYNRGYNHPRHIIRHRNRHYNYWYGPRYRFYRTGYSYPYREPIYTERVRHRPRYHAPAYVISERRTYGRPLHSPLWYENHENGGGIYILRQGQYFWYPFYTYRNSPMSVDEEEGDEEEGRTIEYEQLGTATVEETFYYDNGREIHLDNGMVFQIDVPGDDLSGVEVKVSRFQNADSDEPYRLIIENRQYWGFRQ